jgi:hypothetical protein
MELFVPHPPPRARTVPKRSCDSRPRARACALSGSQPSLLGGVSLASRSISSPNPTTETEPSTSRASSEPAKTDPAPCGHRGRPLPNPNPIPQGQESTSPQPASAVGAVATIAALPPNVSNRRPLMRGRGNRPPIAARASGITRCVRHPHRRVPRPSEGLGANATRRFSRRQRRSASTALFS